MEKRGKGQKILHNQAFINYNFCTQDFMQVKLF